MRALLQQIWRLPTGAFLAAGVIVINAAAVFPRGIQDPNTADTTGFEYTVNVICAVMTVSLIAAAGNAKLKSWTATASGGVWFGFAVAGILAYGSSIPRVQLIAFVLFPLGVSFCSFALARTAELEKRAEAL